MTSRHAVLLTPSLSSRPIQPLSCTQITRETPLIPIFVFKILRTLSFSVSCKSCVCHSYANGRRGYQQFPFRNSEQSCYQHGLNQLAWWSRLLLPLCALCVLCDLCVKSFFSFRLSTFNFQLSTSPFPIPFLFKLLRTLLHSEKRSTPLFSWNSGLFAQNTRCGGHCYPACSNFRSLPRFTDYGTRLTILFRWKIPPAETASAPPVERPRWHRVPGNAGAAVREL